MTKQYDFLVFIGRFQPFHKGHYAVLQAGLQAAQQVIVLCGSAHQPRSVRNPWTVQEREQMIREALDDDQNNRVHIAPLMDILYNDESWVRNVQSTVNGFVTAHFGTPHKQPRVGLIGHSKDNSSYYLNLFPQWGAVQVPNFLGLSATPIREALLSEHVEFFNSGEASQVFPKSTVESVKRFIETDAFQSIREEHRFIEKYKQAWQAAPYTPTFVTVDAVVVQSGHVLMVERKANPGKGLMALPGGFLDQDETLMEGCLRELKEETRIKVPAAVLKGSIQGQRVFDAPYRSARGRTITQVFYIELTPNKELPRVKGSDDAKHAMWVPLAELDPNHIFEDHYFIIKEMTGL